MNTIEHKYNNMHKKNNKGDPKGGNGGAGQDQMGGVGHRGSG